MRSTSDLSTTPVDLIRRLYGDSAFRNWIPDFDTATPVGAFYTRLVGIMDQLYGNGDIISFRTIVRLIQQSYFTHVHRGTTSPLEKSFTLKLDSGRTLTEEDLLPICGGTVTILNDTTVFNYVRAGCERLFGGSISTASLEAPAQRGHLNILYSTPSPDLIRELRILLNAPRKIVSGAEVVAYLVKQVRLNKTNIPDIVRGLSDLSKVELKLRVKPILEGKLSLGLSYGDMCNIINRERLSIHTLRLLGLITSNEKECDLSSIMGAARECITDGLDFVVVFNTGSFAYGGVHWEVFVYRASIRQAAYYDPSGTSSIVGFMVKALSALVRLVAYEKIPIFHAETTHQFDDSFCGLYCLSIIRRMNDGEMLDVLMMSADTSADILKEVDSMFCVQ